MKQNEQEFIYVSVHDVPLTNTRKALIRYFLRGKAYATYSDKECLIEQCKPTANRSITDLYKIVLSRFPNTSFESLLKIIKEFMEEDKSIILIWCNDICKPVIKFVENKSAAWISDFSKKNYYHSKGVDGYSLYDYEEIMNKL
jgi:hypothetical protein